MPESVQTQREAAAVLERLVGAVRAGELHADSSQARRLLRRIEGAIGAWNPALLDDVESAD